MTGTRQLRLDSPAVGGEALGRDPDGRVVFVAGGAPGDLVEVELTEVKKRFARGRVLRVLEPSPDRVTPPCPHVSDGCGGCDWQHLSIGAQHRHRSRLVTDALIRGGGVTDPKVHDGPVPPVAARTTVRGVADASGRFAFRRRRSNEPIPIDSCLVTHPMVEEIVVDGRFPAGAEITIRIGARTGERIVIVDEAKGGGGDPEVVAVPGDVVVVTGAELTAGRRVWFHEEAAGRRWRVSARSFFQPSPEAAEALVEVTGELLERHRPDAERLVDLYAGVGLFAGTVGAGRSVTAVERSASSIADARVNLSSESDDVRILELAVASWRPGPADVVIADPARRGLGTEGAAAVDATGAQLCVLVTCDVGALGRDTRLLRDAGFRHAGSTALDLFPHTGRVEVVTAFLR